MTSDPASRAGAILEIDLGGIVANWRLLARQAAPGIGPLRTAISGAAPRIWRNAMPSSKVATKNSRQPAAASARATGAAPSP